jgi:hypothetical protein
MIVIVPLLALVCYSVARHFAVSALSGWLLVPYALVLVYEMLVTARAARLISHRRRPKTRGRTCSSRRPGSARSHC